MRSSIFKQNQIIDEYDATSHQWLARYAVIKTEDHHVEAVCLFDSLKREYIGEIACINNRCLLGSQLFYWKIDGVCASEI